MRRNWTQQELALALRLYFQTPFSKLDQRNPEIIALATQLGRTPSALAMKLSNFASLDPEIRRTGRAGLSGASAGDRAAWAAFTRDWTMAVTTTEQGMLQPLTRTEIETLQMRRVGQDFFRRAVLSNFDERCCATGLGDARLLVASHIVPWADSAEHRLNPANGLCLSATIDRAFDAGLITLDESQRWLVSRELADSRYQNTRALFVPLKGAPLNPPRKIAVSEAFLARHRETALTRFHYA